VVFIEIRDIPLKFRTKDLRNFFRNFVETKKFKRFHFKKRHGEDGRTYRVIVELESEEVKATFVELYSGKVWQNAKGKSFNEQCKIADILDENNLPPFELNTPELLPQGNVGTPSNAIADSAHLLPAGLFRRLGVSLKYDPTKEVIPPPKELLGFDKRECSIEEKYAKVLHQRDDDPEEWDRYTSIHPPESEPMFERNDRMPTHYRLFEQQQVNNPWDKGDASGLVLYTDASYWDTKITRDERMVDDWDVDYADNEDKVPIMETGKRRRRPPSKRSLPPKKKRRKLSRKSQPPTQPPIIPNPQDPDLPPVGNRINEFSIYDKFAVDSIQKMGWKPGQGLGKTNEGLKKPLVVRMRKKNMGLGYDQRPKQQNKFEPTYRRILRDNPPTVPNSGPRFYALEEEPPKREVTPPLIGSSSTWKFPKKEDHLGSFRLDDLDPPAHASDRNLSLDYK